MIERIKQTCYTCFKSESIHCANEYGDLPYRTLYRPHWNKLNHPFIARGQIRTCGRYQDLAKPAPIKIDPPKAPVLEKTA